MELAKYGKWRIMHGADGVIYCTCPGWRFNRKCKHLTDYHHSVSVIPGGTSLVDEISELVRQQANELKWQNA